MNITRELVRARGADVTTIILGAGVIGVTTAWYLAKAGHKVVVVDRQPSAGLETSFGNGGIIHASEVGPWSQPGIQLKILRWLGKEDAPLLLRWSALPHMWRWGLEFLANSSASLHRSNTLVNLQLALSSLQALQEIVSETGIAYDRATRGVIKVYRSPEGLEHAVRTHERLTAHGLRFERLDRNRCIEIEPALADTGPTLAGGIYFSRDEVGDCNIFTQRLADICSSRGVRFHFNTTVRSLDIVGSRLRGVTTDKGKMEADVIVVALGSFSAPLLAKAGIRVPIYPVKGVSISFERGAWNSAPRVPVIDDHAMFGFVPIGERLRIAGSAEITRYDATPSEERARALIDKASTAFPQMKRHLDVAKARVWAGLRPVTPSGTPIIDETRIAGLWVNSGHGHLGWTLACGSGRLIADRICNQGVGAQSGILQSSNRLTTGF